MNRVKYCIQDLGEVQIPDRPPPSTQIFTFNCCYPQLALLRLSASNRTCVSAAHLKPPVTRMGAFG